MGCSGTAIAGKIRHRRNSGCGKTDMPTTSDLTLPPLRELADLDIRLPLPSSHRSRSGFRNSRTTEIRIHSPVVRLFLPMNSPVRSRVYRSGFGRAKPRSGPASARSIPGPQPDAAPMKAYATTASDGRYRTGRSNGNSAQLSVSVHGRPFTGCATGKPRPTWLHECNNSDGGCLLTASTCIRPMVFPKAWRFLVRAGWDRAFKGRARPDPCPYWLCCNPQSNELLAKFDCRTISSRYVDEELEKPTYIE